MHEVEIYNAKMQTSMAVVFCLLSIYQIRTPQAFLPDYHKTKHRLCANNQINVVTSSPSTCTSCTSCVLLVLLTALECKPFLSVNICLVVK